MLGLTLNDDDEPQEVLLWVKNSEYPYLETNPIHESQKIVREVDGGKILSLHILVNYELEMRLLAYGERVVVLSPEDLNQRMIDRLDSALNNYRKKKNLVETMSIKSWIITENWLFQQIIQTKFGLFRFSRYICSVLNIKKQEKESFIYIATFG